MPQIDELLREFRAEIPPPAPGAAERIVARARAAAPPRAPRTSVRVRLAALVAALATAATLVVALLPGGGGDGGETAGTLLDRAEAAVTPREQILALEIRLRKTTSDPSVVPEDREREIRMREYVLAGAGDALMTRLVITEGSWGAPPTDEDSTLQFDRDGKLVERRSWTPSGGGVLSVQTRLSRPWPDEVDPTLTGRLRDAYERGALRAVGPRDGEDARLRGHVMDGGCGQTDVWLDRRTFVPRRIEVTRGRVDPRRQKCLPGPPVEREVWTIGSERLEANDRHRRLLEIGDWPTARHELDGMRVRRAELPPPPPLDERRSP